MALLGGCGSHVNSHVVLSRATRGMTDIMAERQRRVKERGLAEKQGDARYVCADSNTGTLQVDNWSREQGFFQEGVRGGARAWKS